MKRIAALFTFTALILLLAFSATPVRAEETNDWENYDWDHFSIHAVTSEEWASMCDWFETEAELPVVFSVSLRTDAAFSEDISIVLGNRFKEDPQELIRALAKENPETQAGVIRLIIYHGDYNPTEFAQFLSDLTLSEEATDAEWALVSDMIQYAEENYGMDITNPKTGDLTELLAALFVLSAGGIITTVSWKKDL